MGKKNKHIKKKLQRSKASVDLRTEGLKRSKLLVFSLKNLDRTQGQKCNDWEAEQLLSKALERVQGLCSMTVHEAIDSQILKIYGNALPKDSNFSWPKHIPDDIEWARIAIQGQERIIGYIEYDHIFQVVFLDKNHEFYPSKKKNT